MYHRILVPQLSSGYGCYDEPTAQSDVKLDFLTSQPVNPVLRAVEAIMLGTCINLRQKSVRTAVDICSKKKKKENVKTNSIQPMQNIVLCPLDYFTCTADWACTRVEARRPQSQLTKFLIRDENLFTQ
jgi:hypothetical protein